MAPRPRTRLRKILLVGSALVLVPAAAGGAWAFTTWRGAAVDTVDDVAFDQPLAVPPLAPSTVDAQGRRIFELTAQTGTADLGRGPGTRTWGFDGDQLGPTLRAARGEDVVVHVRNQLDEATSVHWHGMHLPARMDGGPHQPVAPGATWSATWTIDQPAATLWYHPHLHGSTAEHVYRGLAGLFLLDDERAATLGLPDRYGIDDIPLIVQDKAFDGDGQLDIEPGSFRHTGVLGDTVVVNGTPGPHLDVTTERVRLRLLNGSNARIYDFRLDDGSPFQLIATDGGLLPAPVETDHVQLSPGERAEVVVALAPGERRVLRSEPPDLGAGWWNGRLAGGDDRLDVLELRAAERLESNGLVPAVLGGAAEDLGEPARTRTFDLGGTNINGRKMAMDRVDEVVIVGDTEVWEVTNGSGVPHSFHVHDVQFRLLGDVSPELGGWKDTVFVRPGDTVRLIMQFRDHIDPSTPYMFHCHILRHEDRGMMGQFVVVEPGRKAAAPPAHAH